MKRSLHVTAPLLTAAALSLLTGCRRPEMQRCVDEQNRVVDDSLCKNLPNQQQFNNGYHGGYMPIFPYHYYYGGIGGYGLGSVVSGGSSTPIAGHSYASSTTRGGFGSTHGGGSGEGGGGE